MSTTNNQGEFYRRRVCTKQREQITNGKRSEGSSFHNSNSATSRKRTYSALINNIEYYISCLDMCFNNDIQSVHDTIKLFDENGTVFSLKFFQVSGEWLNTANVAKHFCIIGLDGQDEGLPKLKLSDLRKLQTNICLIFISAFGNNVRFNISAKLLLDLLDLFDEINESIELFVLIYNSSIPVCEITPKLPTILDFAENNKSSTIIPKILEIYWSHFNVLLGLPFKYLEIFIPFTFKGELCKRYQQLWWNYINVSSSKDQKERITYLFDMGAMQRIEEPLRETRSVMCLELIFKLIPLVDSATETRCLAMWDFIPEMWENAYVLIIDILSHMIDKKNGAKLVFETKCFPYYFDYLSRGLIDNDYEAKFNQILAKIFVKGDRQIIMQLLRFKDKDGGSCFLKYIRNYQPTNESYTKLTKVFYTMTGSHKIDLSDFKEPEVNTSSPTVHNTNCSPNSIKEVQKFNHSHTRIEYN